MTLSLSLTIMLYDPMFPSYLMDYLQDSFFDVFMWPPPLCLSAHVVSLYLGSMALWRTRFQFGLLNQVGLFRATFFLVR